MSLCGFGAVVCLWSLLIRWAQRARCQAETPLIALFRFPRPALAIGPKHWRKRAEEARNVADKMNDPLAKALMLWIAKDYELVAKRARRTGRTSGHKKKRVTHSASRRRKTPFFMTTTFDGGEVQYGHLVGRFRGQRP